MPTGSCLAASLSWVEKGNREGNSSPLSPPSSLPSSYQPPLPHLPRNRRFGKRKNKQKKNRKTRPRHETRTVGVWKITWWRHAGPGGFTLVMMLPPHEHAAPVGQVVGHDGQPVPPRLHHRLHVVQAVVPAQVAGLQACVNLSSLLKLDDLLGCLRGPG